MAFFMPLMPWVPYLASPPVMEAAALTAMTLAPVAVEAVGAAGEWARDQLWKDNQVRPPSPPPRNSKEDLEHVNARGPMENLTQMVELKLKDQHVWCGHFKSGPPPNNRMNESAIDKMNKDPADVIWHRGVPPSGSKAAVAYSAHSRQWILAWHVPLRSSSSTANKIYVECGPERPIDWNVIEKKLDASSNTSQCDGAYAEITNEANAYMVVVFYE